MQVSSAATSLVLLVQCIAVGLGHATARVMRISQVRCADDGAAKQSSSMLRAVFLLLAVATAASAPAAECPHAVASSLQLAAGHQAASARAAYAAFFLTGHGKFWGSAFHVEFLIDAVKAASTEAAARAGGAAALNRTVLIDVGAAPYNTVGGDISHVLTFLKHWPAGSGATIFGFEPGTASFRNLRTSISKATAPRPLVHMADLVEGGGGPTWSRVQGTVGKAEGGSAGGAHHHSETTYVGQGTEVQGTERREWIVLRNSPVSDRARSATISNQPYAGDNTASLESHYQK